MDTERGFPWQRRARSIGKKLPTLAANGVSPIRFNNSRQLAETWYPSRLPDREMEEFRGCITTDLRVHFVATS